MTLALLDAILPMHALHERPPNIGPERNFIAAILERAILDYRGNLTCMERKDAHKIQRDAGRWIFKGGNGFGSFNFYCDLIAWDASWVRKKLTSATGNRPKTGK